MTTHHRTTLIACALALSAIALGADTAPLHEDRIECARAEDGPSIAVTRIDVQNCSIIASLEATVRDASDAASRDPKQPTEIKWVIVHTADLRKSPTVDSQQVTCPTTYSRIAIKPATLSEKRAVHVKFGDETLLPKDAAKRLGEPENYFDEVPLFGMEKNVAIVFVKGENADKVLRSIEEKKAACG